MESIDRWPEIEIEESRRIYGRRNENTQGILNQIGSTN